MMITIANSGVREVLEAHKTVSSAGGVQAWSLVVGDKSGSRDVCYPSRISETAGATDGRNEKDCSDAVGGLVVGDREGLFRVIDRGEKAKRTLPSSRWPRACGSESGLRLRGKSNRRSRVVNFGGQVLVGSTVGPHGARGARGPRVDGSLVVNEVITSDVQTLGGGIRSGGEGR